jgi:hypothetical protein
VKFFPPAGVNSPKSPAAPVIRLGEMVALARIHVGIHFADHGTNSRVQIGS